MRRERSQEKGGKGRTREKGSTERQTEREQDVSTKTFSQDGGGQGYSMYTLKYRGHLTVLRKDKERERRIPLC